MDEALVDLLRRSATERAQRAVAARMTQPPKDPVQLDAAIELPAAADTEELGERLAGGLNAGDLVVLAGPLGAGKTVLVRGLARGLGVAGPITSPTFVIAREHRPLPGGAGVPLVHVDAYRLGGAGGAGRPRPRHRPGTARWWPSSGARAWPSASPRATCWCASLAGRTTYGWRPSSGWGRRNRHGHRRPGRNATPRISVDHLAGRRRRADVVDADDPDRASRSRQRTGPPTRPAGRRVRDEHRSFTPAHVQVDAADGADTRASGTRPRSRRTASTGSSTQPPTRTRPRAFRSCASGSLAGCCRPRPGVGTWYEELLRATARWIPRRVRVDQRAALHVAAPHAVHVGMGAVGSSDPDRRVRGRPALRRHQRGQVVG